MKKLLLATSLSAALLMPSLSQAATYEIDTQGAHAFIQFKIQHLGYSWLLGRFNTFEGQFEWDAKAPEKSSIQVTIDTASVDSNHAERKKQLRVSAFPNLGRHQKSTYQSTGDNATSANARVLSGDFTLTGVTKAIRVKSPLSTPSLALVAL